jgi:DNA ligase (NAD+)
MTIDKFGETMFDSLINWWEENSEMVHELLEELDLSVPEEKKESNTGISLDNATFCITGKLEHFANRDAMFESITSHNGKYLSGVSTKLNYLVNNDINSTSSKNVTAKSLGIPIITEQELVNMLSN